MDLSFHFWYLQEFRSQHIGQQDTSHTGSHSCLAYSSPSLLGSSIPSICLSCNYGGTNHYLSKPTSYWIPDLLGTETLPAAARPGQRCVPCLLCSAVNPMGYWPSTQYTIWHRPSGFFPWCCLKKTNCPSLSSMKSVEHIFAFEKTVVPHTLKFLMF